MHGSGVGASELARQRTLNNPAPAPSATNTAVTRVLLASLVAAFVLVLVPAAAVAQDAACQQYCDPLAGNNKPPAHGSNSGSSSGSGSSGSSTASAQAPVATQTSSSTTAAGTAKSGLPRTGFPVGYLLLAATLLVSGGWALRRVAGPTIP
jgi:hypothetical protein